MHSMWLVASSQSEGEANADGAIIVNIELTQPTIVAELNPPTKRLTNCFTIRSCYDVIMWALIYWRYITITYLLADHASICSYATRYLLCNYVSIIRQSWISSFSVPCSGLTSGSYYSASSVYLCQQGTCTGISHLCSEECSPSPQSPELRLPCTSSILWWWIFKTFTLALYNMMNCVTLDISSEGGHLLANFF